MTVVEVIAIFQTPDPTGRAVAAVYEGGLNDVVAICALNVAARGHDADAWWLGDLDAAEDGGKPAIFIASRRIDPGEFGADIVARSAKLPSAIDIEF